MKPDVYFNVPRNIAKYGLRTAIEIARFEASQLRAIKELVEKEKIDCDFVLTRSCDVIVDEKYAKDTEEAFAKLSAVLKGTGELQDVQRISPEQAERVSQASILFT